MAIAAVVQLCSTANIVANTALCRSAVERAAKAGARLVCLPEASDYICPPGHGQGLLASPEHPRFLEGIRDQARSSNVYVSVGVHVKTRSFNTQYFIGPNGSVSEPYNKLCADVIN